ncbi:MAG TPA: circadian clock KaiB family protein [Anaerolineales bacterium]|nr:circadian clock KaiB family protein [Anaerolineales bacterium]
MQTGNPSETRPALRCVMRLFVTGNAPNSRIARENLARLQMRFPEYHYEIEIIDLLSQPELALTHGIFIAPTLQVLEPSPGGMLYGNLSDAKVLEQLLKTSM